MLEEALNRRDESPTETVRLIFSFFRQEFIYGGTGAEARFVRFFPILLERLFGPVLVNSLCRNHEFTTDQLEQIEAAWLMRSRPWAVTGPSGSGTAFPAATLSPYGKSSSTLTAKLENDPVVQLLSSPQFSLLSLSTAGSNASTDHLSILRILSDKSGLELSIIPSARATFAFVELPQSVQRALIQMAQVTAGDMSLSSSVLSPVFRDVGIGSGELAHGYKFLKCLSTHPIQQKDFVHALRQVVSLHHHGGGEMGMDHPMLPNDPIAASPRSPTASYVSQQQTQSFRMNPAVSEAQVVQNVLGLEHSLSVQVSLWEKYFLVFVRFPLLLGRMSQINHTSASNSYGERVYLHLLRDYIQYYFPHLFLASDETLPRENLFERQEDQCLVRFMMEFWLERHVYSKTKDAMAILSSQEGDSTDLTGLQWSYNMAELLMVYDKWGSSPGSKVAMIRQKYEAPPKQAQRCIKIVVEHLVADPLIAKKCRRVLRDESKQRTDISIEWPLPTIHTIFQPSLYNYVRTGLRYGPIHVTNSSFYAALDLWLLWIEPWNAVQRKKLGASVQAKDILQNVSDRVTHIGGPASPSKRHRTDMSSVIIVPKANQPSKYTSVWESYVAANLHFYLVPFAIFLRRARELDFSKGYFQKSMSHLQRVLRVYSPQLMHTIDNLLDNEKGADNLRKILESHEDNLGDYCPLRPRERESGKSWNMEMLREEMHNLLEEIVLQHRKTIGEQDFFERIFTKIESFFGEGPKADENFILKLIENAKIIVKFPQNYEVFPSSRRKNNTLFRGLSNLTVSDNAQDFSGYSPDRQASGFLSEKGRKQILEGSRMCNPQNINFIGDPMYARPKSYEVKFLVKWALILSNKLNVYCGLDTPKKCLLYGEEVRLTPDQLAKERDEMNKVGLFRFNLRWLADTRNWILMYLVWKTLLWILRL